MEMIDPSIFSNLFNIHITRTNIFLSEGGIHLLKFSNSFYTPNFSLSRMSKIKHRTVLLSLTDDSWFQINKDGARNVFSCSSLAEKCVEGIISSTDCLVTGHLTIRLDSMLQAVQLPTSITDLATSLTDMDRNTLSLAEDVTKTILSFCKNCQSS